MKKSVSLPGLAKSLLHEGMQQGRTVALYVSSRAGQTFFTGFAYPIYAGADLLSRTNDRVDVSFSKRLSS